MVQASPPQRPTRDRILAAAVDEVKAVGISDFRLARVARAAGVTQAVLYQYFDGREGLITSAVSAWTSEVGQQQSDLMAQLLDGINSIEDVRTSDAAFAQPTSFETDQEFRWGLAQTLVLSWHYPEQAVSALEADGRAFVACVNMFGRMLGPANGEGVVSALTLAFFNSSVWFGGLVSPAGADDLLEASVTTMIMYLTAVAATAPEPVTLDPSVGAMITIDLQLEVPKSDDTRERIIHATLAEVEEVGPVKVTVKKVAARAGVSSALIIHHFKNRTTLLAAANVHAIEELYREMRGPFLELSASVRTPEDLIEFAYTVATIGTSQVDDVAKFRRRIVEALIYSRHDPEALERINDLARSYLADTAGDFERFQALGLVSDRFRPDEMATLMFRFQWGRVLFDGPASDAIRVDEVGQLGILLYRDVFSVG